MLRAPIWSMSAYSAPRGAPSSAGPSVPPGKPVSRRAVARYSRPFLPSPWNEYGDDRGLNAPPRSPVRPASRTWRAAVPPRSPAPPGKGHRPELFLGLDGAWSRDDDDARPAERHAGRDRDDRVLSLPLPRDLLVRL